MRIISVLAAALLAAPAFASDPVLGVWKTGTDGKGYAYIDMAQCGAKICGTINKVFTTAGQPSTSALIGDRIVWDMTPSGTGNYSGGKILRPSNGKTYRSKMTLNGNSLKVSGCVGPVCKGQTWSRVE